LEEGFAKARCQTPRSDREISAQPFGWPRSAGGKSAPPHPAPPNKITIWAMEKWPVDRCSFDPALGSVLPDRKHRHPILLARRSVWSRIIYRSRVPASARGSRTDLDFAALQPERNGNGDQYS